MFDIFIIDTTEHIELYKNIFCCFYLANDRHLEYLSLVTNQNLRNTLISNSLGTSEGRQLLASAMVEPIRRALEYQSIGRRLLMVELPSSCTSNYEIQQTTDVSI